MWRRSTQWKGLDNPGLLGLSSMILVACGTVTGTVLSARVPPEKASCRPTAQIVIFGIWIMSYLMGILFSRLRIIANYWATFAKDLLSTTLIVFVLLITQWGILNRCSCYIDGAKDALLIPLVPGVPDALTRRIRWDYRWIVACGIVFQFLSSIAISWRYKSALRVYMQRDDGMSNISNVRRTASPS